MNDSNSWNVMIRWAYEPHFRPIWHGGVSEGIARANLRWYLRDTHWSKAEYQLVNNYAYHITEVPELTPTGIIHVEDVVVDSWTAVPI